MKTELLIQLYILREQAFASSDNCWSSHGPYHVVTITWELQTKSNVTTGSWGRVDLTASDTAKVPGGTHAAGFNFPGEMQLLYLLHYCHS